MTWVPPFVPDSQLFPFESRWFDSSVGRIHYIAEGRGNGPPILFLHGNPTWSFLWRGMVIRLQKRFRCIALDLPGFGLSERPAAFGYTPGEHAEVVGEFVRHLDLEDLTIVGHDWGGPIGLRVAADEQARLSRLVLGNTWFWPVSDWHIKAFSYLMGSMPMQKMLLDRNLFVERIMPRGVLLPMAPEVWDHYREAQPSPGARRGAAEFPKQLLAAAAWLGDLEDAVRAQLVDVPLLLLWGVHDLMYPARFIGRFRDVFTNVTVRRLDARHYWPEDRPAEAADGVAGFLG